MEMKAVAEEIENGPTDLTPYYYWYFVVSTDITELAIFGIKGEGQPLQKANSLQNIYEYWIS